MRSADVKAKQDKMDEELKERSHNHCRALHCSHSN
jgi:hypothetical protein